MGGQALAHIVTYAAQAHFLQLLYHVSCSSRMGLAFQDSLRSCSSGFALHRLISDKLFLKDSLQLIQGGQLKPCCPDSALLTGPPQCP